jgi:hypothetical protein
MKLTNAYKSILLENKLNTLMFLLEREIKVGDSLESKLRDINSRLSRKILSFLKSDNIKDVNVDYVDYQPENEQLLTLGYTDQKGNQRTKNVKILKLLKYLGADTSDIMGYEVEDLISYFQKGDIDNFKIVTGEQLRDGDTGSCMRHTSAQPYFDMLVNNPKQVGMLVLMNPKNNKIRGRALIWNLDNGERFIDNVYVVNKEFRKDFNSYIEQNNLSKSTNDTVTLDNGGEYDEYPYLDTFMYYTPETGVLSTDETNSEGELKLDGQSGEANLPGVYSEIHNTNIPEDEAVWIAYLDTFVYDHEAEEGIDGKYVYTKDSNAKQIEKGSRYGRWAIPKMRFNGLMIIIMKLYGMKKPYILIKVHLKVIMLTKMIQ